MFGVDYAFYPHPSISALKAAGVKFVGRYVSPNPDNDKNGKNLIPAESKALRDAGFAIILYAEQYAKRMLGGKSAGVEDAQHFAAVTKALGLTDIPMYAAADWDASVDQQPAINAYLDGVASVIGRARTGIYGGYWSVSRALNAGKATHAVQTRAWSLSRGTLPPHAVKWIIGSTVYLADDRADVRQGAYVSVGGVKCDHLTSMKTDFGQWPRPAPEPSAYRHEVQAGNTVSLAALAASRNTTVAHIVEVSRQHLNPANLAILNAYLVLDAALAAAGHHHPAMPEGLVYWTTKP